MSILRTLGQFCALFQTTMLVMDPLMDPLWNSTVLARLKKHNTDITRQLNLRGELIWCLATFAGTWH